MIVLTSLGRRLGRLLKSSWGFTVANFMDRNCKIDVKGKGSDRAHRPMFHSKTAKKKLQFHSHSSCELTVEIYLDLPLQGLHVVYDFIEHDCLANHLKRETFPKFKSERTKLLE
jgi:hypothetical protein